MPAKINLPSVNSTTEAGQLAQIKSYLFYLAKQLQWEFEQLELSAINETAADVSNLEETDLYARLRGYMSYNRFSCTVVDASKITIESQDCRIYSHINLCSIHLIVSIEGQAAAENVFVPIASMGSKYIPSHAISINAVREDGGICSAAVLPTGGIALSSASPLSAATPYRIFISGMYLL